MEESISSMRHNLFALFDIYDVLGSVSRSIVCSIHSYRPFIYYPAYLYNYRKYSKNAQ